MTDTDSSSAAASAEAPPPLTDAPMPADAADATVLTEPGRPDPGPDLPASGPATAARSEVFHDTTGPVQAAPTPSPAPSPRRSGSTLGGIVIGAVLAVGAGYGAQRYVWPQAGFDPAPLEARLTAAEAEAQALRAELAKATEMLASPPPPASDPALDGRIAALEGALQAVAPPDLAPLTTRIDTIETRLAAMANAPASEPQDATADNGATAAALAALQAEVAALKSQDPGTVPDLSAMVAEVEASLAEAEAKAGELTAQANAIAAEAARNAALAQIGAAFDSGLPYGAALTALGAADIPEAIAAHAEAGLPSVAALRASFPDAARLALEAALRANPGESWTDRVATFLRNQTGARSLGPRDGTDPDAVLSRAEAALAQADVAGALTELAALPPEATAALSDWVAQAQRRLDAQAALAGLLQGAGQ